MAVAAAPAVLASPASATGPVILGPSTLVTGTNGSTSGYAAAMNSEYVGSSVEVPGTGTITAWRANADCSDVCGQIRLVTLRPTLAPTVYTAVEKSDWETPITDGVDVYTSALKVQSGDRVALEFTGGGKVYTTAEFSSGMKRGTTNSGNGATATYESSSSGQIALYNATFTPVIATTTTLEATPEFSLINTPVAFDVNVVRDLGPSASYAPIGGKVTLYDGLTPLTGCVDVTVTAGKASCVSNAPAFQTYRYVTAKYQGDANYAASQGSAGHFTVMPAEVLAKATPNLVERSGSIVYGAQVAMVQLTSVGPAIANYGTAAFFVDGQALADCAAQPVNSEGKTTCAAVAPDAVGAHTLKVVYSGANATGPGQAEAPFEVIGRGVKVAESVSFGSITAGATETRTVTLTGTGKSATTVSGAALTGDGPFTIVTDGCAAAKLGLDQTCDVVVAYRPAAAGTHTSTLVFAEHVASVALSGTAVAPAAPVAPTPTPTPPKPGATIDPEKKPTFTVSVPSGGDARSSAVPTLSLPLSCPANTECQLDGVLTIEESVLQSRKAKASAASTKTVAKFSKVQVQAGGLKTVKLKLSPAFVKSAQKRGIRRIRATLTINTVLGSGEKLTTAQRITIVIPRAAKKTAAKQQVKPKFTG